MHWGKERGSMNERAWEREREGESENSRSRPSFQAAKLCLRSALWQRQPAGMETQPGNCNTPGITSRGQGHGTPPPTPGDTHGTPHATHAPALGCPALWGALEDTRTCLCVRAQIQTRGQFSQGPWVGSLGSRDAPLPSVRILTEVGWPWGAPLLSQPCFSLNSCGFSQYCCEPLPSPCASPSTCTQPRAHCPGDKRFRPPPLPSHLIDIALELKCVLQIYPGAGVPPQPLALGTCPHPLQLPCGRARVDKGAWEQVFRVWRPPLPGGEGAFRSRRIRSGSGCLGSA